MKRGFTLIEVLLSLAIIAAILVALNSLLFGIVGSWGDGRDRRLFDQHRRALARQLNESFREATERAGGTALRISEIAWSGRGDAARATWSLPSGGRLTPWAAEPLPDVDLVLEVDKNRGLVLGWRSRAETDSERDQWHEALLSPFAERVEYGYRDATSGQWQRVERPLREGDNWLTPDSLRIYLRHEKEQAIIDIPITSRREGASPP